MSECVADEGVGGRRKDAGWIVRRCLRACVEE